MSNGQVPVHSGFDHTTTAAEVVRSHDLSGRVAIVTGGASGIGLETTRALASAGALVMVAARDVARAQQALEGIGNVELATLDLADSLSIDAFAQHFLVSGRPLHALVNNAGVMATPFGRDARGYETQFATNHLGHFQLTVRLWPALRQARDARIVSVASRGHRFAPMHFDDPNFAHRLYDRWVAYGQSKTANVLFAVAADARGLADDIRVFAVHPGRIMATNLLRFMSEDEIAAIPLADVEGRPFTEPDTYIKTIEEGAATSVWCAISTQLDGKGGIYCEDCDVSAVAPVESQGVGVRPYAIDPSAAERLWILSEHLTGVALTP